MVGVVVKYNYHLVSLRGTASTVGVNCSIFSGIITKLG